MALKFGTNTVNEVNFVDGDNTYEVKKIVKDGDTVWCKSYTFSVISLDGATWSASIVSTEEPTASTGALSNGNAVHYNDFVDFSYISGSESSSSSSSSPTSISAPKNLTKVYTGSLSAKYDNQNAYSVTVNWEAKRGTTKMASGTTTANASTTGNYIYTGVSGSYANQVTLYVYFTATKTTTTTTTTTTYSGSVVGIDNVTETESMISGSNKVQKLIRGNVSSNVRLTVGKITDSSDSTSTSTLTSSTSSVTLGY